MNIRGEQNRRQTRRDWLLSSLAGTASMTTRLTGAAISSPVTRNLSPAIAAAGVFGCGKAGSPLQGQLLRPGMQFGHRLRDKSAAADPPELSLHGPLTDGSDAAGRNSVEVVIAGGGIAGLAAGWRFLRAGFRNFRIFEVESVPGGTSRSGESTVTRYPWGAHYVPLPNSQNHELLELFAEMQAVKLSGNGGAPTAAESVACREPQERLFVDGSWLDGLYPHSLASETDLQQWDRFRATVRQWIDWRDPEGHPAFVIPAAGCSRHSDVLELDTITAAEWLRRNGFDSDLLYGVIDYCCRDDYGLTPEHASAWAALFYFASRMVGSGIEEPPLLTWPEGNGAIVRHLSQELKAFLQTSAGVEQIVRGDTDVPADPAEHPPIRIRVVNSDTQSPEDWTANHLIFAAPQFLTPYLIPDQPATRLAAVRDFSYGAWVVANLHLSDRPGSSGAPLSWDNVIWNSPSLGYVVATHQLGSDYGPTVWTWYYPLCDPMPARDREQLLSATWEQWVETILQDLSPAHPELRGLLTRIDVMIWGHAMIQPRPGFVSGVSRSLAAQPLGNIRFANTDLSGIALMEEAFYHGVRAADEILSMLSDDLPG